MLCKQTNADRIRAMTDEELAETLCLAGCNKCDWNQICGKSNERDCENDWLDWLKQEAEGGTQ